MLRPGEAILQEIFSLLSPKDILSCSATCKRFNGIITSSSPLQLILYRKYLQVPPPSLHAQEQTLRSGASANQELTRIIETERNLQNLQPRYDSFTLPSKQKILAVGEGCIVTQHLVNTEKVEGSTVLPTNSKSSPDLTIWSRSPITGDEQQLRWTHKELQLPVSFEEEGIAVDVREGFIAVIETRNKRKRWNGNEIKIWLFLLFNEDVLAEHVYEKPLEVELGSPNIYSPAEITFIPGGRLEIRWDFPNSVQILDPKCRGDIKTLRFPFDETFDAPRDLVYVGEELMITHVTIPGFFEPATSGYILIYDLTNIPSMIPHNSVTQPDLVLCLPHFPTNISHFAQLSSETPSYGEHSEYCIDHDLTHISSSLSLDGLVHVGTPVRPSHDSTDSPSYTMALTLSRCDIRRLMNLSSATSNDPPDTELDRSDPLSDMFGLFGQFTYFKWDEWQDKCFIDLKKRGNILLNVKQSRKSWAWGPRELSMLIECHEALPQDHLSPSSDSKESQWGLSFEYNRIDLETAHSNHLGKALGGLGDILPCTVDARPDGQPSDYRRETVRMTKGDHRSYSLGSMKGWIPLDDDKRDPDHICFDGRMVAYQNSVTDEVNVWDFGAGDAN
ncbi:hypothetical protein I302_107305 [Kwoniella bestiolae CBS 10118]|uniref:F-box domain-containing protein n=1 Tax=Kwoniella bestiolae CBS 10118 TaxID=1296100 RepID=A0A1B9FYX1_9TREE|nr:hypothetical protein I302_06959 [Kwoniella bestiolae CBS 10118]OCF23973.1 hypothetical protein I302_06959 [Kwoniella bestiolae CBS 10118]